MSANRHLLIIIAITVFVFFAADFSAAQNDDSTRNVLKQGLLGAGTGAIAAGTTGGKAGQGALIGAGTNVIGSALLDAITAPPSSSGTRRRAAPPPDEYYYADEPADEYYYEDSPQEPGSSKVLKQGLVGAGTGALASGMSGGNAGKGALIGAGTNVIGSVLLDTITQPPAQKRSRVYRRIPKAAAQGKTSTREETVGSEGTRKKIIRKYDDNGKVVSEEEIYY